MKPMHHKIHELIQRWLVIQAALLMTKTLKFILIHKHISQHHSLPMFSSPSPGLPRNDGSCLRIAVLRPASSSPNKLCSLGSIPLLHFLSSNSNGEYTWEMIMNRELQKPKHCSSVPKMGHWKQNIKKKIKKICSRNNLKNQNHLSVRQVIILSSVIMFFFLN